MKKEQIIETATAIAEEYRDRHSLTLTLRQLYYQFVARGLLPNGQQVYKRLGAILSKARLDGSFEISHLEDRSRRVGLTDSDKIRTVSDGKARVAEALASMPYWLRYGRWYGQPKKVFVWVEKEALSGVLEGVCSELGVGLFPCKGYPSISALADWVRTTSATLERRYDLGLSREDQQLNCDFVGWDTARIIYLGDHDPDGLQIPTSAAETIRSIMEGEGLQFDFELERVALTVEQIEQHDPPPMPAKMSSSRFQGYFEATGLQDAWELDALDPPILQRLVRDSVGAHFDPALEDANRADAKAKRLELINRVCEDPAWIEQQLRRNV